MKCLYTTYRLGVGISIYVTGVDEYAESDVSSESEYEPEPRKEDINQTEVELFHEEDYEIVNEDEFGVNSILQQMLVGEDDAQDLKAQVQGCKLQV